ncbi:MAG: hypothetical protein Q9164_005430 [Protoblastenia rupestris]
MRSALGLLALCLPSTIAQQYVNSFFVLSASGNPLSARLDPIVAPDTTPSNHVHEIFGGDTFSANWDYENAQSSTCNNIGPKVDHSNYWFPALYFHGADDSYTKVPPGLAIYYKFDTRDNGPRTMFPDGFKMIAGNAMLRHNNTATSVTTRSIRWYCHGPDKISVGAFPEGVTDCPGVFGFSAEIWFPFCWDGINEFDASDPLKHVVYGESNSQEGGKCPESHPKAFPQLFMEFHHDIKDVANKPGAAEPWVLAQGDATGYGMHADFVGIDSGVWDGNHADFVQINGWENGPKSLKDAIAVDPSDPTKTKCFIGNTGADKCFEMHTDAERSACKIGTPIDEEVDGPIPALPGCNPIQPGPEDATIQTNCAGDTPSTTQNEPKDTTDTTDDTPPNGTPSTTPSQNAVPEADQKNAVPIPESNTQSPEEPEAPSTDSSSNSGLGGGKPASIKVSNGEEWVYQGCYSDLDPDRTVRALETWGRGKTSTDCAKHCLGAGFKIAGTEYGTQCFCGNEMKQSKKLEESKCNTACDDDENETCGGSSSLSVYAKEGASLGLRRRSHLRRHAVHHVRSF